MQINDLVKEFADCVAAHQRAVENADPIKGNEFAARYLSAFETLRSFGNDGRNALGDLFDDARPAVRVMAAAFLLRHCEDRARPLLEREAAGTGLIAFGASQALQRWKDGSWSLDPLEAEAK
jgi:hypothetical protein